MLKNNTSPMTIVPYEDGGLLLNQYGLPEYGFGSWIKANGAGLLKGAGSLVSMIPGIGQIAGPVLSTAGSVIGGIQENNAAQDQANTDQQALDLKAAEEAKINARNDRGIRQSNIVDQNQMTYAGTFATGGQIGNGFMQQPQITSYSNGNTHQEGVGGIPVDARGNPATTSKGSVVGLTEKGEVTWKGYVFSDKLKIK